MRPNRPRSPSSSSATRRSSGVVTLRFSAATARRSRARRSARSARRRRSPRRASPRRRPARARAPRGGRPAASAPPTAPERSSVSRTAPPSVPARLIVSVTGAAAIAASARWSASSAASTALGQLGRQQRPRGVVDEHGLARPGAPPARAHRLRAHEPPATPTVPAGACAARRQRDDDLLDRRGSPQRVDAPLQHRPSRQLHERLRYAGSEALAAARGHDQGDCHRLRGCRARAIAGGWRVRESLATCRPPPAGCWPSRRAARRGSSRPPPRPCRARTSARRRGSSWCG